MPSSIHINLLYLLRETCFGDGKDWFSRLSPEEQEQLCTRLMTPHLCCWGYRKLHDVLPEKFRNQFRTNYLYRSNQVCQQQKMKEELFALFEAEQIRFAPIKGADLAFELYEDPVLRYFCDLDILIHPEDALRALDILDRNDWPKVPYKNLADSHHHYTVRSKNHVALEPHKTLPNFDSVPPLEIWQHIHPVAPGRFQHRLEPELRLFLLLKHAQNHHEEPVYKLLLDAGHILKNTPVDREKSKNLSRQWHFPDPGDFLAAFPDFFPEELLGSGHKTEKAILFRQLFEHSPDAPATPSHQVLMSQNIWSAKWWKIRLEGISARALRNKYHLPERGAYCRLCLYFVLDLSRKSFTFFRYLFHRDRQAREYYRTMEKINHYEQK